MTLDCKSKELNLGDALLAEQEAAEDRGCAAGTMVTIRTRSAAILRLFGNELISNLNITACKGQIIDLLDSGQNQPQSIKVNILPLLNRACTRGGRPRFVKDLRESLGLRLHGSPPPGNYFSRDELAELLRRAREILPGRFSVTHRDRQLAIIELMAMTGIRMHELSRVQVGDVREGELLVLRPKVAGLARSTPLLPQAQRAARLLAGRRAADRPLVVGGPVYIRSILKQWSQRLGVRLTARSLRHSFATGLLESGATLAQVRDLMGHTHNSAATLRYLHSTRASQLKALAHFWEKTPET